MAKYDRRLLVRDSLASLEAEMHEKAKEGWEIDPVGASKEVKDVLEGLMTNRIPAATLWIRKRQPGT